MFVAEALFNFSKATMCPQEEKQEEARQNTPEEDNEEREKDEKEGGKRQRSKSHDKELKEDGEDKDEEENEAKKKDADEIVYLAFEKGEKILVEQAFENGWWFGNAIKRPNDKGFFPSNYVQVGAKPPPPAPPKQPEEQPQQ